MWLKILLMKADFKHRGAAATNLCETGTSPLISFISNCPKTK